MTIIKHCYLCQHFDSHHQVCLNPLRMEKHPIFGQSAFGPDELNPYGQCGMFEPDPLHLTPGERVSGWKRLLGEGR